MAQFIKFVSLRNPQAGSMGFSRERAGILIKIPALSLENPMEPAWGFLSETNLIN